MTNSYVRIMGLTAVLTCAALTPASAQTSGVAAAGSTSSGTSHAAAHSNGSLSGTMPGVPAGVGPGSTAGPNNASANGNMNSGTVNGAGIPNNTTTTTDTNTNAGVNGNVNTNGTVNNSANSAALPTSNVPSTLANQVRNRANWETENQYWQNHFSSRPYATVNNNYTVYQPAYQYGLDLYNQYGGRPYNELDQEQLRSGWEKAHSGSNLSWNQAQSAARDEYMRLYEQQHNPAAAR